MMKIFHKQKFFKDNKLIKKYKFCDITLLRKEKSPTKKKWNFLGIKISYKLKQTKHQNINTNPKDIITINKDSLITNLWGAFKEIDVRVKKNKKRFINIIMPNLAPKMSAGPLSIIWMGKKLSDLGYNIRILPLNTDSINNANEVIAGQEAGLEEFAKNVIVDYSIALNAPVYISPNDMTIATLFISAYFARQIQAKCKDHNFIYMIQDYERDFFSASSLGFLSDNTYHMDYYALFSSKFLEDYFIQNNIGHIKTRKLKHISYLCPCNSYLPSKENFILNRKNKKQFVFYARPHIDRNAYALSAYIIIKAVEKGIFKLNEWEFWGVGSQQKMRIDLGHGIYLNQLPNMSLDEYKNMLPSFDIMLSLMATPHHSMPPIDAALSGCVVVTNSSDIKTQEEFNKMSHNIIACNPDETSLLEGLKKATVLCNKLEDRYKNSLVTYPTSMEQALTKTHHTWFKNILK